MSVRENKTNECVDDVIDELMEDTEGLNVVNLSRRLDPGSPSADSSNTRENTTYAIFYRIL